MPLVDWLDKRRSQPDGSVFLKVEVTVENAYGNKIKTVAEGTVVGAAVKDFHVSGLT